MYVVRACERAQTRCHDDGADPKGTHFPEERSKSFASFSWDTYGCEKLTNKSSRRGGKVLLPRFGGSASILYRRRRFRRRQQAVNFSRNFGRPFTPQTRLESSPNFNTLHYKPSPTFHFSILIQVKNTNLPAQKNTNIFSVIYYFLKFNYLLTKNY